MYSHRKVNQNSALVGNGQIGKSLNGNIRSRPKQLGLEFELIRSERDFGFEGSRVPATDESRPTTATTKTRADGGAGGRSLAAENRKVSNSETKPKLRGSFSVILSESLFCLNKQKPSEFNRQRVNNSFAGNQTHDQKHNVFPGSHHQWAIRAQDLMKSNRP